MLKRKGEGRGKKENRVDCISPFIMSCKIMNMNVWMCMSINKCAVLNIYCICVAFLPAIVLWAYGEPPLFAAMFAFFILPAARVRLARACATATGFLLALEVVKYEMCRVNGRW